ncbi:hypothetical protein [Scytonema millei]|uniref:Uncharacterized protein n=1 Tax=Scytonema millei VB511283 TaxID=1245923 RepID=A0A9X5E8G9_9CYAN|nr:hypothetical protein [Scytonema millei]NHC37271.1 hypothetical protein [Scytonema millei VB511283]
MRIYSLNQGAGSREQGAEKQFKIQNSKFPYTPHPTPHTHIDRTTHP